MAARAGLTEDASRALEADLAAATDGEVRFDAGSRGAYATDASNYRQVPIGIVVPRSVDDVEATMRVCREHQAPVLSRGGGTSLAGQCCNVAVVVDWTKYLYNVIDIDAGRKVATVEPGCVLDRLRSEAKTHGLTFGADPATHTHCTIGGMIGNNSCGVRSLVAGRTSDNVESLDVLTYRGERLRLRSVGDDDAVEALIRSGGQLSEIARKLKTLRDRHADEIRAYPDIPRRVSGFNLDELLPERGFHLARAVTGSEGTCVAVTRAEVRLIDDPPVTSLLVLGYPDVGAAADDVVEVAAAEPRGLEGMDRKLHTWSSQKRLHPDALRLLPEGDAWLLVQFGGETEQEADAKARALMKRLGKRTRPPSMELYDDPESERQVWQVRESGLAATARIPADGDTWAGWEDSAVPPDRLGDYLRDLTELCDSYDYESSLYGHFGQGCVHARFSFDLVTAPGIAHFRSFINDAADLAVSYGGSLSGEHGDGQARGELLPKMFGPDLVDAFREFKHIWDPDGAMNPGKVVDPYDIDENLRLGSTYAPSEPVTFFKYGEDDGRFSRAALRCVGVGACRREDGGVMCPSYQVTREEEHSTRGRARLLFEMLKGEVITDGWRSTEVRDALDLCLACKGCKNDCPMSVDMGTYKAEFLAHHYARRLRPASHYSMGWLPLAARAASRIPNLVNRILDTPKLSTLVKRAAGIDPKRQVPQFAPHTFQSRSKVPRESAPRGSRVIVFPDTFTNFFDPQIGTAALDVLRDAGLTPVVPDGQMCCGLTWISTGQLKTARRVLGRTVEALREEARAGTPVLGLEPSCTAVLRSDLKELFADDEDALRLSAQTFTLGELLQEHAPGWEPPTVDEEVIVQEHCHQKSVLSVHEERRLMERAGMRARFPESGCCGLAGNFGFERGHYDVSMACAERELLPAVREASGRTVVADGFSCRTQIDQAVAVRRSLHLVEVLAGAIQKRNTLTPRRQEDPRR